MKKSRFAQTEIACAVKQAEAGVSVRELARKYGVSEKTIYAWRNKHGKLPAKVQTRLKQLEQENTRLKQMVAELSLDKAMLKEILQKKA